MLIFLLAFLFRMVAAAVLVEVLMVVGPDDRFAWIDAGRLPDLFLLILSLNE